MSSIKRPIQIEEFTLAIQDLSVDNIRSLIDQLNNSIDKLRSSNQIMAEHIDELSSKNHANRNESEQLEDENDKDTAIEDDIALYKESITENDIVLRNQVERLSVLNDELSYRAQPLDGNANTLSEKRSETVLDTDNTNGVYI